MRRFANILMLGLGLTAGPTAASVDIPAGAEAVVFALGDQHSAYDRTAQLVVLIRNLRAANPGLPALILLNGDTLEHGNPVARRSAGAVDFAMHASLARVAPTVLNLGNHEPEFHDLAETVKRIEATGVKVVGNITDRATGKPFAPASFRIPLGETEAVIVGLTTDRLNTFRAAVRPSLDLADPVVWAQAYFPQLLGGTDAGRRPTLPIILSHAGLKADRALFPLVLDGALFVGGHNHLRLLHRMGRTVYFHSGWWNECLTVVWLCRDETGAAQWEVEQVEVDPAGPADAELSALIAATEAQHLEAADREVVGHLPRALTPAEAARLAVEAFRVTAGVDAAVIGNTTFGGGLPAGEVTRYVFDACVRFDGAVAVAEVDGRRLAQLLARANPGPDTPFADRQGEYLVAAAPAEIDPARIYRLATNDWGVRNQKNYFDGVELTFTEVPGLRFKSTVLQSLAAVSATLRPPHDAAELASVVGELDQEQVYELGRSLFEAFAPEEIKEQFEFPTKEQWDGFATRFQQALAGDRLEDLAEFEPEARAALVALRALPGHEDYADWLEERIDYVEAAKQAVAQPEPTPAPPSPAPAPAPRPAPVPGKPAPAARPAPNIPHYALWLGRMQNRPVPPQAAQLLPMLRRTFAGGGIPADLAWLAEAESTFNPNARSPSGAKGLFQLMQATAQELGLSTFLPDERTHPEKSARAAAQLLRKLHAQFGDWPLALAAYNAGAGRVQRTLDKKGAKTFAEIASSLPAETRMYVPKVLATLAVRAGVTPDKL
jgi:2',3'-cyclic-nucleotide 2'-phosphodiesterase (5'-nucleotidase family)